MSLQMENEDGGYYFQYKDPRFFKVITQESRKLDLPKKFVRLHGAELLSSGEVVYFKVARGTVWKLGLGRDGNNNMWFHDGWLEFVKFYDLKHGHFLAFTYQGKSKFDVAIYDWTACEIRYPVKPCSNEEEDNVNHGLYSTKTEDRDIEILEEVNLCKNAASFSKPGNKRGRKAKLAATSRATSSGFTSSSRRRMNTCAIHEYEAKRIKQDNGKIYAKQIPLKPLHPVVPNADPAYENVMNFISTYPSFKLILTAQYLKRASGPIEIKFARRYLIQLEQIFKLKVGDKLWNVKALFRNGKGVLSAGWLKFVRDNNLEVGDTCVFELIKMEGMVINVSILRSHS